MIIYNLISEFNTSSSADDTRVPLFKHGSKEAGLPGALEAPEDGAPHDVEKGKFNRMSKMPSRRTREEIAADAEKALETQEPMTDIFTWQHINYTIPISGHETLQLLDDVSGYVVPGKLTALMGESGAGKVR